MSNKKSEATDKSAELQELESRVDAMMSTELAKAKLPKSAPAPAAKKTSSLRVISNYDDSRKTAPELSPKLLKNIKTDPSPPPEPSAQPEPPAEPTAAPASPKPAKNILEDSETDKAVEDIVVHEGDTQLAVDDAIAKRRTAEAELQNQRGVLSAIFTSYWTWLFIIGIAGVTYAWFH